ncbi:MAG: hypothetical protein ACXVHB_09735 [Solirubrobacteraceae bacterium]
MPPAVLGSRRPAAPEGPERRGELGVDYRALHPHPYDRSDEERGVSREPDDPQDREAAEVSSLHAQKGRPEGAEHDRQHGERAHRAQLRQPSRRQVIVEQEATERAVEGPERRGGCRERVAELGRAVRGVQRAVSGRRRGVRASRVRPAAMVSVVPPDV